MAVTKMTEEQVQLLKEKHRLEALENFLESDEASTVDLDWVFPQLSLRSEEWKQLKKRVTQDRAALAEIRNKIAEQDIDAAIEALMAKLEK